MNSKRPLKDKLYRNYGEEYEEYYYEEETKIGKPLKLTLYGLIICVCVGCIWLFAIFLPNYFIPESKDLKGIVKVTKLNVSLTPLSEDRVKKLGLPGGVYEISGNGSKNDLEDPDNDDIESENYMITEEYENEQSELVIDSTRTVERLILIGDIHGHYTKLRKLLRKVRFNKATDHVLMLGDFIAKGPDSIKVLDFAIENNIDCILGNHEWYVLQNYAKFHHLDMPRFMDEIDSSDIQIKDLFNSDPEYLLAKKLQPHHVEYINKCLVIKTLGNVPLHSPSTKGGLKYTNGIAVHGGLRWDLPLADQDSLKCLEMRSYIGPFFNDSTDDPFEKNAISWSKIWNHKQKEKSYRDAYSVYYGHDARRGLKLKKFSKGLDTGCFKGGRLSAMVLWEQKAKTAKNKPYILHKEMLVSVSC